jgi:hypothetical protein
MNIEYMTENIDQVFNDYNINILFTINSLPCKISMAGLGGLNGVQYGNERERKEVMNQKAQAQFNAQSNQTLQMQKMIVGATVKEQQTIVEKND